MPNYKTILNTKSCLHFIVAEAQGLRDFCDFWKKWPF